MLGSVIVASRSAKNPAEVRLPEERDFPQPS